MLDLERFRSVVDRIVEHVAGGQKVVLRGMPKSGRSYIVDSVGTEAARVLGIVPVRFNGDDDVAALEPGLERAIADAKLGLGLILIDGLGGLLRSVHGATWQTRLNSQCVDGGYANSIGVLIACGTGENLSRIGLPGSPLADSANVVLFAPTLSKRDVISALTACGTEATRAAKLVSEYGGHLALIADAEVSDSARAQDGYVEGMVLEAVAYTSSEAAERLLDLGRRPNHQLASSPVDEGLAPLVFHPEAGSTQLVPALRRAGLGSLLIGSDESWPSELKASTRRFRARTYGQKRVLWFDRYFGRGCRRLVGFLDVVAAGSGTSELLLLGSNAGVENLPPYLLEEFQLRQAEWRKHGLEVAWHLVDDADFTRMHDRQLISVSRTDGYSMPPCTRVIGHDPVGNAVDTYLPRAPVSRLLDAWSRSRVFAKG